MDAKAMFKVKWNEFNELGLGSTDHSHETIFSACIIAAAVGNGLEALTKAINDNTEEYRK